MIIKKRTITINKMILITRISLLVSRLYFVGDVVFLVRRVLGSFPCSLCATWSAVTFCVLMKCCRVITLRAKLCGAVYCNRSCLWVGLWVCYHDKSKLRASIFTKLGL